MLANPWYSTLILLFWFSRKKKKKKIWNRWQTRMNLWQLYYMYQWSRTGKSGHLTCLWENRFVWGSEQTQVLANKFLSFFLLLTVCHKLLDSQTNRLIRNSHGSLMTEKTVDSWELIRGKSFQCIIGSLCSPWLLVALWNLHMNMHYTGVMCWTALQVVSHYSTEQKVLIG